MAKKLTSKPNVETADPDYPNGRFQDDSGVGDGTPLNLLTHGDIIQTFLRLLERSGRGPGNDLADNATNGYELYESLGFWQQGDRMFLYEGDMSTPAGTIAPGAVRYNKFCLLGNTLQWMVNVSGATILGSQSELYLPIDGNAISLLGGSIAIDNHLGIQLGYLQDAVEETLLVKQDITTEALILTRFGGGNFDASIGFQFHVTIPLISTL